MNYPGYTLVRREDCPEQHGVLTVLNHDVSGATVLLVENTGQVSGCIRHLSSLHSPVFLLNSCLDLFSAPRSSRGPFIPKLQGQFA